MTEQLFQQIDEIIQFQKSDEIELFLQNVETYVGTNVLDYDTRIRDCFDDIKHEMIYYKPWIKNNEITIEMKKRMMDGLVCILGLKYAFTVIDSYA